MVGYHMSLEAVCVGHFNAAAAPCWSLPPIMCGFSTVHASMHASTCIDKCVYADALHVCILNEQYLGE